MSKYNLPTLLKRTLVYKYPIELGKPDDYVSCQIPIRIPMIQRDYAEGRKNDAIEGKRRSLLTDMLQVVYGIRSNLSFDFVYGTMCDDSGPCSIIEYTDYKGHPNVCFEPLDGQQRLTTLFLLYWFFKRTNVLTKDGSHSLFIYKTRTTSEEFCNWLICKDSKEIISSWENCVTKAKALNKDNEAKWNTERDSKGRIDRIANRLKFPKVNVPDLLNYMQSLDDFKWDWHDDPNIRSMIVVLESTYKLIIENGWSFDSGISGNANLDNISFLLLDDLDCNGDELFEKMNARGKALTSFEILKSSLQEEMEKQDIQSTNLNLYQNWISEIDGKWVDYFWDNSNIGNNPTLETVREVEHRLEVFILHMICRSFFNTPISRSKPLGDGKDYGGLLESCISSRDMMCQVMKCYIDYERHERSLKNKINVIDFQAIKDDIDNMLYKDNSGKWKDVSMYLSSNGLVWNHDLNCSTLLDDFLNESGVGYDTQIMFYALTKYLRYCPASSIVGNNIETRNFVDWMRFIRNVFSAANKTVRADDVSMANKSMDAIDSWLEEYFKTYHKSTSTTEMLQCVEQYIASNPFGQEQQRLDEEKIKAILRKNITGWDAALIDKNGAENNYYLWGQIIAPLSWSKTPAGTYDLQAFTDYMTKLNLIFDSSLDKSARDIQLSQAILCITDYRSKTSSQGLGSLRRFNNARDFSWKRYLRDDDGSGYCGKAFKDLVDEWLMPVNTSLPLDDFLKQYIASHKINTVTDWRYYITNMSSKHLLEVYEDPIRTQNRFLYLDPDDNHSYLIRSNTLRSTIRYELLTTYLAKESRLYGTGVSKKILTDKSSEDGAALALNLINGDIATIIVAPNGLYDLKITGASGTILSGLDVLGLKNELVTRNILVSF